jgi:uncharacterized membrane protein YdbT with pleckstrin-like domain
MEAGLDEHVLFEGHPSWRSTLSFYLKGLLVALVVAAIVLAATSTGTGVAVFAGIFGLVIVVGFVRRMATRYLISTRRLQIRRGIVSRKVQEARLDRVQNVNTSQSILERLLQVGTVDFDTAGTGDSDFAFRGVSQPEHVVEAVARAQHEAAERPAGDEPAGA